MHTTAPSTGKAGLTILTLFAALALAACGATASSSGSVGPSVSAEPIAPTAEPTTGPDGSPTEPAGAFPTFDVGELVNGLENVDSYRVVLTSDGEVQYEGVVVTRPVLSRDVMMSGDTHLVVIGDEAWMGSGSDLQPVPGDMASSLLLAADPALMVAAFAQPGALFGASEIGTEEKNGVQAKHYRIDASSIVGALASMPPGASIDIWIADDGYLVSMTAVEFGGGDFSLDVTNVNDPANVVERPN